MWQKTSTVGLLTHHNSPCPQKLILDWCTKLFDCSIVIHLSKTPNHVHFISQHQWARRGGFSGNDMSMIRSGVCETPGPIPKNGTHKTSKCGFGFRTRSSKMHKYGKISWKSAICVQSSLMIIDMHPRRNNEYHQSIHGIHGMKTYPVKVRNFAYKFWNI